MQLHVDIGHILLRAQNKPSIDDVNKFKSMVSFHVAANMPPQAWLWCMGKMLSHVSRGHSAFGVYKGLIFRWLLATHSYYGKYRKTLIETMAGG